MAFGCCACAMKVFRPVDDQIDEARLARVLEEMREEGGTDEDARIVQTCDCDCCHVDGQSVMC